MNLFLLLAFTLLSCFSAAFEADWNITWVTANPDGRLVRPVIGVNGVWPPPQIHVNVGDRVVVTIHNQLGNESTTMHWHGLYQRGSSNMDGPSMVTQCPILPGMSYTYNFTIDQPGTYWYHAHDGGQYPDGLRGPIIVHDPMGPFAGLYDEELVLTFSDWYHDQMPQLIHFYLSAEENADGGEPVPYSGLLNEGVGQGLMVEPNKTYLLRIVSLAAFSQATIWIDDHNLTIIETDGIYTQPTTVEAIYIAAAQRYSVLLRTKPTANKDYTITAMMDTNDFDDVPNYTDQNCTAYLMYGGAKAEPVENAVADTLVTIDEFDIVPYDRMPALSGTPDHSYTMNLSFFTVEGQNRAGFNNLTYVPQKVPTLFSVLSAGAAAHNASIYGRHTNPMMASYGDLVEIVINNFDDGAHIIHLHGHQVQLVAKVANVTAFGGTGVAPPYAGDVGDFPQFPMRRDTWILAPNGYTVIRFRADNPGVWLFHCHMEWHVDAGLIGTLISGVDRIQQLQPVSPAMEKICHAQGIQTAGNAAGNTHDFFDLHGTPNVPMPLAKTWGAYIMKNGLPPPGNNSNFSFD